MAKGFSFSADSAKRIAKTVRAYEGNPSSLSGNPIGGTQDGGAWLKIKTSGTGNSPRAYTVDVYISPYDSTPVATGKNAKNVAEIGLTSTGGLGYQIAASPHCGEVYGFEKLTTGLFVRALQLVSVTSGGTPYYLFWFPLIPQVA